MKPNAIKSVIAAAVCLASMHSQAQNVSKLAIELQGQKQQMWSVGKVTQVNPEIKTQEIYTRTLDFLKSPNRVQKMGGMDGGGGNALLCNENGRVTTELLDVYEARSLGVQFDLGGKNNMLEILDHVFNRLSKVSPLRATVYSAMARDLLTKDTQWVTNKQMPVIDDVNLTLIPQNCLLVQVAIQRPLTQQNLPNVKTYIIDSETFNLLDETSKAALVLHEILYREARFSEKADSLFTRQLVGLYMSNQVSHIKLSELNDLYINNSVKCLEDLNTQTLRVNTLASEDNADEKYIESACNYIKKLNYKVEYKNRTNFDLFDHKYSLSEKWSAKSGTIESYFLSGESYATSTFRVDSHVTSIQLAGGVQFESTDSNGKQSKSPVITFKIGRLSTLINFTDEFDKDKKFAYFQTQIRKLGLMLSPYNSESVKQFGSLNGNRIIKNIQKTISSDKINFQLKTIFLEKKTCEFRSENCLDSIVIEFNSKVSALEIFSKTGTLKVYHQKENRLQAFEKKGIRQLDNNDWVTVEAVRFDSTGNISEYAINSPATQNELIWIKYQ